jgi:hypothetical protein
MDSEPDSRYRGSSRGARDSTTAAAANCGRTTRREFIVTWPTARRDHPAQGRRAAARAWRMAPDIRRSDLRDAQGSRPATSVGYRDPARRFSVRACTRLAGPDAGASGPRRASRASVHAERRRTCDGRAVEERHDARGSGASPRRAGPRDSARDEDSYSTLTRWRPRDTH